MSADDIIHRLSQLSLFAKLEPGALRLIAFAAETRHLRAGDILFREGDVADCGYLLLAGALTLDGANVKGNESVPKTAKEGDLLGEIALIVTTKRPVTAIARQTSTVLRISRALFLRVLEEYPASADRMRRDVLAHINALNHDLEAFRRGLISDVSAV
jgi:CRP-like cAMP-binding protein